MFISAPPGRSRSLALLVAETGAEYGLSGWLGRPPTPEMVVRRGATKNEQAISDGRRQLGIVISRRDYRAAGTLFFMQAGRARCVGCPRPPRGPPGGVGRPPRGERVIWGTGGGQSVTL